LLEEVIKLEKEKTMYPKTMYHATKPKKVVNSKQEEDTARTDGYGNNPVQPADKDKR
jgi:hypothetical protein